MTWKFGLLTVAFGLMESMSSDYENDFFSSDEGEHHVLSSLLRCDLSLSGLIGSLSLELSLWHSVASFLTLQICRVRRQYEVVSLGLVFDLLSVLLPTVASFFCLPSIKDALQQYGEGVVMGGMCRHYSVMQAGWNVFQCSSSAFFFQGEECFSRHLCCRCCQPADRKSTTRSVEVAVTCATTPLSQRTKNTSETKRRGQNAVTTRQVDGFHAWRNGQYRISAKCVSGKLGEGLAKDVKPKISKAARTQNAGLALFHTVRCWHLPLFVSLARVQLCHRAGRAKLVCH